MKAANDNVAAIYERVVNAEEPAPLLSDDAVAQELSRRHPDLRYVAESQTWLRYSGFKWEKEKTLLVYDLARKVCRDLAIDARGQAQMEMASKKKVTAAEFLARSDRRHASTIEAWDADPWLLNTPTGAIDLNTGLLRQHDPDDYFTKATAVGPADSGCPLFLETLHRIFAGDQAIIEHLQRYFGYALTGVTHEHTLHFGHGNGGNGKSTIIDCIRGVMGDYAAVAPAEIFTASDTVRHPTELAGLVGKRLVVASETEERHHWSEARVKALTGGDVITARFMRQDFFSFRPQLKLFVVGNHKPGLRNVDEAIRRRLHLVPFNVTIPESDRDPELPEKLKVEWPGVLAWMLEGTAKWLADGLMAPPAIKAATAAYLADQDSVAAWIEDCCELGSNHAEMTSALYHSWEAWAKRGNEFAGTLKRFAQKMQERGFTPHRQGGTGFRQLLGIRLRPAAMGSAEKGGQTS